MIPETIERDIVIEAPPSVVWKVITEPELVKQWFADQVELDLQPGGHGVLGWEAYDAAWPIVIQDVEHERRLSYRWVHPEGSEPRAGNSTLVVFTLIPEGDRTRLQVSESGWHETDWSDEQQAKFVDEHERGWTKHITTLAELIAAGVELARTE